MSNTLGGGTLTPSKAPTSTTDCAHGPTRSNSYSSAVALLLSSVAPFFALALPIWFFDDLTCTTRLEFGRSQ